MSLSLLDTRLLEPAIVLAQAAASSNSDAATLLRALTQVQRGGDMAAHRAALAGLQRSLERGAAAATAWAGREAAQLIAVECVVDALLRRAEATGDVAGALQRIVELEAVSARADVDARVVRPRVLDLLHSRADVAAWHEWQALLRWRAACRHLLDALDDVMRCLARRLARAVAAVRAAFDASLHAEPMRVALAGELTVMLLAVARFDEQAGARRLLLASPELLAPLRDVVRCCDAAFSRATMRSAAQLLVHLLLASDDGAAAVWAEVDWACAAALERDDGAPHVTLVRALCVAAPQLVLGSPAELAGPRLLGGVLHHCNTSRDAAVRVVALSALNELMQLVAQHRDAVGDAAALQRLVVQPIETTLLLCFDTALDTFGAYLRDCLRTLMALASEAWLHALVQRVAQCDFRRRSTLGVLSVCLAHRDVAALMIAANPHIVRDTLGALTSSNAEMLVLAFVGELLAQRSKLGDEFWLAPCVDWLLAHGGSEHSDTQRQHLRVIEGALLRDAANVLPLLLGALWARQRKAAGLARLGGIEAAVFEPLVALLHVARKRSLVPAAFFNSLFERATTADGEPAPLTPMRVLEVALAHHSATVRQVAFEALGVANKISDPLGADEVALMRRAVLLTIKGDIGTSRQMTSTCLASFLARFERSATDVLRGAASQSAARKQAADATALAEARASVRSLVAFVNELVVALTASIYPGAVYQRVEMALELFGVVMRHFPQSHRDAGVLWRHEHVPAATADEQQLPVLALYTPQLTTLLLGKLLDLYDSTRLKTSEVMTVMPTPLPGLGSRELLQELVRWALRLMSSLRGSEGQMGAQALTLLLTRSRATWPHLLLLRPDDGLPLVCDSLADVQQALGAACNPAHVHADARLHVCRQLLALLRRQCDVAREHGLEHAAQHAPMHGVLLGIRAVLAELDVPALLAAAPPALRDEWRQFVSDTCAHVSGALLGLVLEPLLNFHEGQTGDVGEAAADGGGGGDDDDVLFEGDPLRLVSSLCWIAVKEAARCLSSLLDVAPLDVPAQRLLTPSEVRAIGAAQVRIMLQCQHKGGMERSYAAFVTLCTRALSSAVPELVALPIGWLRGVLQFVRRPNRALYHTRRSAGLPFIICGILVAERQMLERNASTLLPPTVRTLLAAAAGQCGDGDDGDDDGLPKVAREFDSSSDVTALLQPSNAQAADVAYSAASVTQVHALNVLRALMRERSLNESMTTQSAAAFDVVLDAFVSPVWGVRNSATMLFATLVDRTTGAGLSARDLSRMSFPVFFSRFSSVLPHIFASLQHAHGAKLAPDANEQSRVFATLVLLSRLAPSAFEVSAESERLVPLVLAFANHRHLLVRRVASRALAPLVSRQRLPAVLAYIASLLPTSDAQPWRRNVVHGLLQHTESLLKSHAYAVLVARGGGGGGDDSESDEGLRRVHLAVLPDLLERIGWMMSAERICPAIASLYFKLVHTYVQRTSDAPEHGDFVDVALRLLRAPPADMESRPDAEECLRRATKVALFDALRTSPGAARSGETLLLCATHRFGEVRRTTFDVVLRAARSWPAAVARDALLGAALRETLAFARWIDTTAAEGGEAFVSHGAPLAAASALPFLLGGGAALPAGVTLPQLWAALCRMALGGKRRFGAAVEPALCALGAVAGSGGGAAALELDGWVDLVDAGSRETSDLSLRMATLESLAACGGVWRSEALPREARARLWLAAGRLVEDDDADIRVRAGALVFATLPMAACERASGRLLAVPIALLRFVMDEFRDTQAVRALLVRLLCSSAPDDALARLGDAQLLAAVAAGAPACTSACFDEPWSETRSYFDTEPPNTFAEPLVAVEAAVRHLGADALPLPLAALQAVVRAQLASIRAWFDDVRGKRNRSARGEWLLYEPVYHAAVRRTLLAARALQLGGDGDALVQWLERASGQRVPPTIAAIGASLSADCSSSSSSE